MKKINIIRKNEDFNRIITRLTPHHFKSFIIYIEYKTLKPYQFGISVSKKLGNAVTRNKIKRQVKNIIDQKNYEKSFNCIIIIRKNFLSKTFLENKEDLLKAFEKLTI